MPHRFSDFKHIPYTRKDFDKFETETLKRVCLLAQNADRVKELQYTGETIKNWQPVLSINNYEKNKVGCGNISLYFMCGDEVVEVFTGYKLLDELDLSKIMRQHLFCLIGENVRDLERIGD